MWLFTKHGTFHCVDPMWFRKEAKISTLRCTHTSSCHKKHSSSDVYFFIRQGAKNWPKRHPNNENTHKTMFVHCTYRCWTKFKREESRSGVSPRQHNNRSRGSLLDTTSIRQCCWDPLCFVFFVFGLFVLFKKSMTKLRWYTSSIHVTCHVSSPFCFIYLRILQDKWWCTKITCTHKLMMMITHATTENSLTKLVKSIHFCLTMVTTIYSGGERE